MLGAGLVAFLIAAVFGVLLWSGADHRSADRISEHIDLSIERAHELEDLVVGLQRGERGFLLTGDERFLEPWTEARRELPRAARTFEAVEHGSEDEPGARRIADGALSYLHDYSAPLVALAREDRAAARRIVAAGEGNRRLDALLARLGEFVGAERLEAVEPARRSERLAYLAVAVGVAGLVGTVLLVALFFLYLSRAVVTPVRRLAGATGRLAAGELSARVPDTGRRDEIGELGAVFNAMAGSLQEMRDELESQNAELEAQQGELERAVSELADERDRVVALHRFAEHLAAESEVEPLALAILDDLATLGRAELGAIYAVGVNRRDGYRLASSRGFHPDRLDAELEPGDGLAGRALAERAPIAASYGETGLTIAAWGEEISLRHELHLPLVQGDRVLGVVTLARVGEPGFSRADLDALESMAGQASVALSNALALRRARREASVTRAVLDATPDGICLTDVNGQILLANAPMLELSVDLGLSMEGTVHERLLSAADRMSDPDVYRDGMAEIVAHPDGEFRHEYTFADSERSFLGYVAPVRDSTGTLTGRLFILRETTAERQAERLKDELVATVSHELRTPLTSIIGYLEFVLEEADGELMPEHRRFLEVVDRNARRLLDVVGDLLFVAQVEAGRLVLDRKLLEVAGVAAEAVETARPLAEGKGVALRLEAGQNVRVRGDQLRLAQLLGNLVSNAVKFTPEGGTVDVRVVALDGRALLEVADTGIGVPLAEQERMFQRFFRSSRSQEQAVPGTGLGLVICRAIAEAHGGSISFTSTDGVGTTFRVELPLAAGIAEAA
jgi:signal transduction histidine kinase/CHASE3 domain sensor protein